MQKPDSETLARTRRVQALCQELGQLVTLSLEQRRVIDQLLTKLEAVTSERHRARLKPLTRAAGASPGRPGSRPSREGS